MYAQSKHEDAIQELSVEHVSSQQHWPWQVKVDPRWQTMKKAESARVVVHADTTERVLELAAERVTRLQKTG